MQNNRSGFTSQMMKRGKQSHLINNTRNKQQHTVYKLYTISARLRFKEIIK